MITNLSLFPRRNSRPANPITPPSDSWTCQGVFGADHSYQPLAGTMQRRVAKLSRKVGFSVTVSMRALIRKLRPSAAGGNPQLTSRASACRPFCTMTGADCDGARFQRGCKLSMTVTPNSRINSSGDAVLVKRPHMMFRPFVLCSP